MKECDFCCLIEPCYVTVFISVLPVVFLVAICPVLAALNVNSISSLKEARDTSNLICSGSSMILLEMTKTNANYPFESSSILTSGGLVMLEIGPGFMSSTASVCLERGNYYLHLQSYNGVSWADSSVVTIDITVGNDTYTILKSRLQQGTEMLIPLSLSFLVFIAKIDTSKRYLADGTVPSGWNDEYFSPTSWTSYDPSSPPTISQAIVFLHASFTISSIIGVMKG